MEPNELPATGPQLRKYRRAAEVTVTALAVEIGRPRPYVHELEGRAVVDPEMAAAYRVAVEKLRTVPS